MSEPFIPQDEIVIRDVETMKVVADEQRLKILKALREPATVKEIAAALGSNNTRLYYHVRMLEQHGLIQVVGINIESGIVEKSYQATARRILIRNPILAGAELPAASAVAIYRNLFDEARDGFAAAFANRAASEPEPPRHPFASRKSFRLTESQLTEFHARLDALIKETDRLAQVNEGLAGEPFDLLVAFYRPVQE